MALSDVRQPRLFVDDAPRVVAPPAPVKAPPPPAPLVPYDGWRPDEIPHLNGEKTLILNAETTGLQWWASDRPAGWSYLLPESGRRGYLPVRHDAGNLPLERVLDWLRDVRGVCVSNVNTKFDLHMARMDGVDLREQGCTFADVAHEVALLEDERVRFNLDQLSKDLLGWDVERDGLGKLPEGVSSEGEWHKLPSWAVKPYAVRNVEQVHALSQALAPRIAEEQLERTLALERQVIPVVVEMEANGTFIDLELLREWQLETSRQMEEKLYRVFKQTGILIDSPDSPRQLERLFAARSIPITARTELGAPSFTANVMKAAAAADPCIADVFAVGQFADLKSKYLDKYELAARADGWLRFNLHQLRTTRGEDERVGAVSGRFSAAGDKWGGYNPQQVVAVEKQLERGWCPDFVVRRLFKLNFAADMAQVEYRLFAHYAQNAQILAAYAQDPWTDYHAAVMKLLHTLAPHLNRKLVKNINFAKIYGAGLIKFALMLGLITEAQYKDLVARQRAGERVKDDPLLQGARELMAAYDAMMPDVAPLLKRSRKLVETRGYVRDIIGRRARPVTNINSALNRIVQGGAASLNKLALVEAYERRRELGLTMRLTVHDELAGDLADPKGQLPAMMALLNRQRVPLRVPILWDGKIGNNWAECK